MSSFTAACKPVTRAAACSASEEWHRFALPDNHLHPATCGSRHIEVTSAVILSCSLQRCIIHVSSDVRLMTATPPPPFYSSRDTPLNEIKRQPLTGYTVVSTYAPARNSTLPALDANASFSFFQLKNPESKSPKQRPHQ